MSKAPKKTIPASSRSIFVVSKAIKVRRVFLIFWDYKLECIGTSSCIITEIISKEKTNEKHKVD